MSRDVAPDGLKNKGVQKGLTPLAEGWRRPLAYRSSPWQEGLSSTLKDHTLKGVA